MPFTHSRGVFLTINSPKNTFYIVSDFWLILSKIATFYLEGKNLASLKIVSERQNPHYRKTSTGTLSGVGYTLMPPHTTHTTGTTKFYIYLQGAPWNSHFPIRSPPPHATYTTDITKFYIYLQEAPWNQRFPIRSPLLLQTSLKSLLLLYNSTLKRI